jgi:hypothetical protein
MQPRAFLQNVLERFSDRFLERRGSRLILKQSWKKPRLPKLLSGIWQSLRVYSLVRARPRSIRRKCQT